MSHTSLTYHIVFGTYRRLKTIVQDHEKELYIFIYNFSTERNVFIRRIGGMPDHIHILCDIPPKMAVADYVQLIKAESSKFMRVNSNFPDWDGWGEGYGCFTVDASCREVRRQYIMHQREHHRKRTFREEYMEFLAECGISLDDIKF